MLIITKHSCMHFQTRNIFAIRTFVASFHKQNKTDYAEFEITCSRICWRSFWCSSVLILRWYLATLSAVVRHAGCRGWMSYTEYLLNATHAYCMHIFKKPQTAVTENSASFRPRGSVHGERANVFECIWYVVKIREASLNFSNIGKTDQDLTEIWQRLIQEFRNTNT